MNGMAQHASPGKRDHLWVLAVIAACALLEVWASWLGIGSVSGFPKLGKMTTGWILPVTTEAYWGYAVWAWLASSPGPRSRRFAMWTAIVMFTLSLGGQEAGHLVAAAHRQAPSYVVAFVTALPLIAVGLIAILIHLRQADREEAARAVTGRAEADERAGLRRKLAEVTARAEADVTAYREAAEGAAAEAEAARSRADALTGEVQELARKLADARERAKAGSRGRKAAAGGTRKAGSSRATGAAATVPGAAQATGAEGLEPPEGLTTEELVQWWVGKGKSASAAGVLAGVTDARGRQIMREVSKRSFRVLDGEEQTG